MTFLLNYSPFTVENNIFKPLCTEIETDLRLQTHTGVVKVAILISCR